MAHIIEAPADFGIVYENPSLFSVFLAGSIENGKAEDWQTRLSQTLSRFDNLIVLNPRRKNWNPDFDGRELTRQIMWEQEAIKMADLVVFYFDPSTHSPISLLELGQMLGSKRKSVVVYCPPTFFRHTNVDITCGVYGVKVHADYHTFVADIISRISLHCS